LKTLGEWLPKLGPYKSERITTVVERAKPCAVELDKLLEMTDRRYEAGDKWNDDEQSALTKQEKKMQESYKAWRDALEN
jgi:hypothetical protein